MIICALSRSWMHHSNYGGMEMQLYFLIKELCKSKCTVYLITTPSSSDTFTEEIDGLNIIEIPNCAPTKYSNTFFYESTKIVNSLKDKIDLLYYVSGGGGCWCHKIISGSVIDVFKNRLPSVITLHNGCDGQESLFIDIFKHVNGVVFSHKQSLDSTDKIDHANINKVCIPTSSDCDFTKLKNVRKDYNISNNLIITFVASKIALNNKGFNLFVAITEKLNKNVIFFIVGDCNQLIINKYKKDNIIFTGKIKNDEVKNILFSSDYYLIPTDWKTKGFDGTISEALLAGTRVVATRSEIAEKTLKADNKSVWYFNKNEYIEKTVDLILNNKRKKDPKNSINLAKQFSTQITMKNYLDFFQLTIDDWLNKTKK